MATLPSALLNSLENVPGFNRTTFEEVHRAGEQITSIRVNPAKLIPTDTASIQQKLNEHFSFNNGEIHSVPWSSFGYYFPQRPSFIFDPLLHAGVYYVQEASSMFLEQAMKQCMDLSGPLRVLDLCAAPGGKTTLLQSIITKESLLVSNDAIKSRAAVLQENCSKWGADNIVITNNDPSHFARLKNYFDVVVVDAPCSGSGLFRRDPNAINEWSENNVDLCSQRQQRIIADVWPSLKENGILIYSTCSYSPAEDENILSWIGDHYPVQSMRLQMEPGWKIVETTSQHHHLYGYRFYPDQVAGEGLFMAALQKLDGGDQSPEKPSRTKLDRVSKTEDAIIRPWLADSTELQLVKQNDLILALPDVVQQQLGSLQGALYIKQAGISIGTLAGRDLIPHHAFALSRLRHRELPTVALDLPESIKYLRRDDMQLATDIRGWAIVTYKKQALGWVKILPNRFNNYYPKEWRILKQPQ